jgi:hypothetical protein
MRKTYSKPWNMAKKLKNVEMRQKHCRTWNMAGNTEKHGK